jgi:hypothetical protein
MKTLYTGTAMYRAGSKPLQYTLTGVRLAVQMLLEDFILFRVNIDPKAV